MTSMTRSNVQSQNCVHPNMASEDVDFNRGTAPAHNADATRVGFEFQQFKPGLPSVAFVVFL